MAPKKELSRRTFLTRGGAAALGIAAWTTPTILTLRPDPALAGSNAPTRSNTTGTEVKGASFTQEGETTVLGAGGESTVEAAGGDALPRTGAPLAAALGGAAALIGSGIALDRAGKKRQDQKSS